MNVPAKQSYRDVPIASHGGGGMLMPQTFGEVVSFSEIMARSQHAIPKHLRDVPGACLAVAMQAMRWSMDPFAVASKSYNVKDIIAYEAQLIAAVVHTRAPLKTRPDYHYTGEGADRRCTVSAQFDDGVTRSYESPRIGDIAIKNSPLWKADPDQQLGYYSIRAFARRYCPEVILGVYTPEEAETFRGPDGAKDVTPKPSLGERLAAASGSAAAVQTAGFSHTHVISEIGADVTEEQNSAEPPSQAQPDTPAGVASSPQPPAGTQSEDSPAGRASGEGGGDDAAGEAQEASSPPLPEGWARDYAAALRRAQKKESLPKYASQFWDMHGGWDAHKSGVNGPTAAAIFDAFKKNFGDKDAIEAELRELI
jgi:hypothetical protein